MPKRQLKGIIISDKMDKTVVVKVEKVKEHPKYRRKLFISHKYKAHVENGPAGADKEYKEGDKVIIEECKPISKEKNWKVVGKA